MRAKMDRAERAKQFMPFAALEGLDRTLYDFNRPEDERVCLGEDAQISESNWTFVGLGSERSFFDIYGTNPPLKQYRSAWDFYDNE